MLSLIAHLYPLAQAQSRGMFDRFQQILLSPEGAAAIVLLLTSATMAVIFDRFKWILLAVCIYVCSYSTLLNQVESKSLPPPFSFLTKLSQPISFGCLALLALSALRPTPLARRRGLHITVILLLVLQMAMSTRHLMGAFQERGVLGFGLYPVIFLVLGVGIWRWLYSDVEARALVRAVSWAALIMVICSLFVLAVKPGSALAGRRFIGTTANAQRLAAYLSLTIPYSLAMFADRRNRQASRQLHLVVASVAVIAVLGTGSRTGTLMSLVGLTVFFRKRLGTGLLALAIGGCVLLGVYSAFYDTLSSGVNRVFSTMNTRDEVWSRMYAEFMRAPMIGVDRESANENSFLTIAAGFGLMGLLPAVIFGLLFLFAGWNAARWRSQLDDDKPISDLISASVAQFFTSWMFEGFLAGALTDHIVMLFCLLALMSYLSERIAYGPQTLPVLSNPGSEQEALPADHPPTATA